MTTEQRIREAFNEFLSVAQDVDFMTAEESFFAGYMALLNELEPEGTEYNETLYRLPEGVT